MYHFVPTGLTLAVGAGVDCGRLVVWNPLYLLLAWRGKKGKRSRPSIPETKEPNVMDFGYYRFPALCITVGTFDKGNEATRNDVLATVTHCPKSNDYDGGSK